MDISYLGASGLFTCIISAILSVEVTRLLTKKKIIIRLPDSMPSMVGESFAALIPLIVNAVIAVAIGSCVHPYAVTGIELENGIIRLVKWSMMTRADSSMYIGRKVVAEAELSLFDE